MANKKKYSLGDILDIIEGVRDVASFDIIATKAKETKEKMINEEIEIGDVVELSDKCSKEMNRYRGREMTVLSKDRDGRYYIDLGGIEAAFSRDKILLIRKGGDNK